MNTLLKFILLLLLPFLIVILVNEFQRTKVKSQDFKIYGVSTMNTAKYDKNTCTWVCHNSTTHCKTNHATLASEYSECIDPVYYGIINGLHGTGDYGLANVLLLVLAWPLLMCYLLIRILQMKKQLKHG